MALPYSAGEVQRVEHIRNKYFLWGAAAVAAIVLGAGAAALAHRQSPGTTATRVLSEQVVPTVPDPISLGTAFAVVQKQLDSMPGAWVVTSLASVDAGDNPTASSGEDGSRDAWVADIRGPDGEIREVQIVASKVVRVIAPTTTDSAVGATDHALQPPAIDSSAAVARARAAMPSFAGAVPSAETAAKSPGFNSRMPSMTAEASQRSPCWARSTTFRRALFSTLVARF